MADKISPKSYYGDFKGYWAGFGDESYYQDITSGRAGSLAAQVVKTYGLPLAGNSTSIGGPLAELDIYCQDALSVIKMSLLEASADDNRIYEPHVNSNGEIEFITIGGHSGGISDVYYQTQNINYTESCAGVMIMGGKPVIERIPKDFRPIWGSEQRLVWSTSNMLSNCSKAQFDEYAVIAFTDPHLQDNSYKDGIDGLFDDVVNEPNLRIMGYVYYYNSQIPLSKDTTVELKTNDCKIPVLVAGPADLSDAGDSSNLPNVDIGTLQIRPIQSDQSLGSSEGCWAGLDGESNYDDGIDIFHDNNFPDDLRFEDLWKRSIDKFNEVVDVYVTGIMIDNCKSYPIEPVDSMPGWGDEANSMIEVAIHDSKKVTYRLDRGQHYAIAFPTGIDVEEVAKPRIVFAFNGKPNDPAAKTYGTGAKFKIRANTTYFREQGLSMGHSPLTGTILPISYEKAILVLQVWALVSIDCYSIEIHDARGKNAKAKEIAEKLSYQVMPLVVKDAPAPIAFKGKSSNGIDYISGNIINLSDKVSDHDPRTKQNFEDTSYEKAMDVMNGGGLTLRMVTLSDSQLTTLSNVLYDYLNNGSVVETIYTCGPNCRPVLGGNGASNGVINSITYSYTDRSSYTISVTEGGKIVGGIGEIAGGPTEKASEDAQSEGTIIQDLGNHIHYKVRIDGFGVRVAINTCPTILRVGDRVKCVLHNVPVEA